ncbi:Alkaline phosphatase, tissue-nonspecific isozyme [Atta colombica]|uniref:alkaline phosphatase n=1 Tax=Atta colombica TaxID=520822 RepID=A0A195ATM5_9HYME|nr:Alkaline phosphatase, tissue-nonspecific isozyme [Atta colombica]
MKKSTPRAPPRNRLIKLGIGEECVTAKFYPPINEELWNTLERTALKLHRFRIAALRLRITNFKVNVCSALTLRESSDYTGTKSKVIYGGKEGLFEALRHIFGAEIVERQIELSLLCIEYRSEKQFCQWKVSYGQKTAFHGLQKLLCEMEKVCQIRIKFVCLNSPTWSNLMQYIRSRLEFSEPFPQLYCLSDCGLCVSIGATTRMKRGATARDGSNVTALTSFALQISRCYISLLIKLATFRAQRLFQNTFRVDKKKREVWYETATRAIEMRIREAASTSVSGTTPPTGIARGVVLFVGDGMGMSTLTAARILAGQRHGNPGEETQLAWESFPAVALARCKLSNAVSLLE